MMTRGLLCLSLLSASVPALAHPGHGYGDGYALLHYLSAPEHAPEYAIGLLLALGVVGGLVVGWRIRGRRRG